MPNKDPRNVEAELAYPRSIYLEPLDLLSTLPPTPSSPWFWPPQARLSLGTIASPVFEPLQPRSSHSPSIGTTLAYAESCVPRYALLEPGCGIPYPLSVV